MKAISFLLVFVGLTASAAAPLRIAFLGAFTSPSTSYVLTDINIEKGVKTFFSLHPEAKKDLTVDKYDNRGDAAVTQEVIEAIHRVGIQVIVGLSKSNQALVAAPIVDRLGMLLMTPLASHDDVTKNHPNTFRVCYADSVQGEALAKFSKEDLKAKKVLVFTNLDVVFSVNLSKRYLANLDKGTPLREVGYVQDKLDLKAIQELTKEEKPDVVFVSDYVNNAGKIVKALYEAYPSAVYLGGDGWGSHEVLDEYLASFPKLKAYYTTGWSDQLKNPVNQKFLAGYKKLYPEDGIPGSGPALMYDALSTLWVAYKETKGAATPDSLKKVLLSKTFNGTTGPIRYPDANDPTPRKKVVLLKYGSGKHELFKTY